MTTIRRNQNVLVFWKEMMKFNPDYYYYILTESQKRLIEFDVILKTLNWCEKDAISNDRRKMRTDIYDTSFPILTQHVIAPIASIIYEYYTLNEEQLQLFDLHDVYRTLTQDQKKIVNVDRCKTYNNLHSTVFSALPNAIPTDIVYVIYYYL